MSSSERVNTQVMHLLSGVSMHGDQHLADVERGLVQMDVLLGEAIKKLCASFMSIHRAVGLQQDALKSLAADDLTDADYAARIETLSTDINLHVDAALTGLQFQDMTSQLIDQMVTQLAGLRDVFGELDMGVTALPEGGNEAFLAKLDHIRDRVCSRSTELADGLRSTVTQRHMGSGDIKLF